MFTSRAIRKRMPTRLGLQCQTPALTKVYFTWAGTIILGLKKNWVQKKSLTKKIFDPKRETKSTP